MTWYSILKTSAGIPYGEYWIDENGHVEYADSDMGKGHCQFAFEHMLNLRDIGYNYFEELLNANYPLADGSKDIYSHLAKKNIPKQEITLLINGFNGNDCDSLIQFAMKNWGWKRVEGNRIETWTINPHDLQIIVTGLNDIAQEDEAGQSVWTIDVAPTRNVFMNVPLNVLEKGPKALARYNNTISVHPFSEPNQLNANSWYSRVRLSSGL